MDYGIAPAKNRNAVTYQNGSTRDIMKEVLDANQDPSVWAQVKGFAKMFTRDYDGLCNLYWWLKNNIQYVEDPSGVQWIREPSRLWADKEGDCKSFTLFLCAVARNMGIQYTIRFVTYSRTSRQVTHVYPIFHLDGQDVIMDAVWTDFDAHKTPFYLKKDFKFMEISRLSGIGAAADERVIQTLTNMSNHMTSVARNLPQVNDGVDITTLTESEAIAYLTGGDIAGIGSNLPAFTLPTIVLDTDSVDGIGSWLSQAGAWVKKQATSVVNTIKDTIQSVTNWVFKTGLKKAAPFFLFAFIQRSVSKRVDDKRVSQQKSITWIANVMGTSEAVAMASIADGIKSATGKTPQQALNEVANGQKVAGLYGSSGANGVGAIPVALIMAAIEVIQKLVSFFKKKDGPPMTKENASDVDELAADAQAAPVASENTGIIPNNIPRNADKLPQSNEPRDINPTTQNGGRNTANNEGDKKDNSMLMWGGVALVGFYLLSQKDKGVGYIQKGLDNKSNAKCNNSRF